MLRLQSFEWESITIPTAQKQNQSKYRMLPLNQLPLCYHNDLCRSGLFVIVLNNIFKVHRVAYVLISLACLHAFLISVIDLLQNLINWFNKVSHNSVVCTIVRVPLLHGRRLADRCTVCWHGVKRLSVLQILSTNNMAKWFN